MSWADQTDAPVRGGQGGSWERNPVLGDALVCPGWGTGDRAWPPVSLQMRQAASTVRPRRGGGSRGPVTGGQSLLPVRKGSVGEGRGGDQQEQWPQDRDRLMPACVRAPTGTPRWTWREGGALQGPHFARDEVNLQMLGI